MLKALEIADLQVARGQASRPALTVVLQRHSGFALSRRF